MIAWEKIDNTKFENLAFDYMASNYPDIRWEKTTLTNDGNKDGQSIISTLPFNTTIKYWYEASGRRHQAIAYHVLAAIYYSDNDLIQSKNYSKKCLQLFGELGEDYKQVQSHNATIKKKGDFVLASETTLVKPCDFILDTRIW